MLRDRLLQPACFPDTRNVALVETHASWVFLTDHEVYKLKKPVDLGFLNYTTIDRRRRACEAEVELNRRLAPDVYLGVVPVRDDGGQLHVGAGADGALVDYAVRMVRLPDATRADVRLANDALSSEHVDRIARRIAQFHASARSGIDIDAYGAPERIAFNVEENFAQTRDALCTFLRPEEAVEIVSWQRRFLRERAHLFEQRVREGRIKDGHGDLRLEHVYFGEDGVLRIIDCIEFDERFRHADVAADIAFLSMDLGYHNRVDLAERLLATYAEETGDFGIYDVVDFYMSYRAYVRAKIATILATSATASPEARERAGREARRYFVLALASDRRSLLEPSVTAVGGMIAAGKSTVAAAVARELGAPIVSADRTRKQMLGVPVYERLDPGTFQGAYDPAFTERVYQEMLLRAERVIASGRPVVLDASFRSTAMRDDAHALARRYGVPFHFVECRTPIAVVKARLAQRETSRGVSDARLAILNDFQSRFEPVTEMPPEEHVVVDTSRPIDETLAVVKKAVETWPPGVCS